MSKWDQQIHQPQAQQLALPHKPQEPPEQEPPALRPHKIDFDTWRIAEAFQLPLPKQSVGMCPLRSCQLRESSTIGPTISSASGVGPSHRHVLLSILNSISPQKPACVGSVALGATPSSLKLSSGDCRPLSAECSSVQQDIRDEEVTSALWAKRRIRAV